ncbi:hypothetical protein Taro_037467 [Colocasia esculenta]|uniref:Uncharacterized protein n=1 Tax=Colocasia esculenta TaxID=4460 RepID=A0A843WKW3_COLES|nr:hypothetical protein [Colocasia esculenta]
MFGKKSSGRLRRELQKVNAGFCEKIQRIRSLKRCVGERGIFEEGRRAYEYPPKGGGSSGRRWKEGKELRASELAR